MEPISLRLIRTLSTLFFGWRKRVEVAREHRSQVEDFPVRSTLQHLEALHEEWEAEEAAQEKQRAEQAATADKSAEKGEDTVPVASGFPAESESPAEESPRRVTDWLVDGAMRCFNRLRLSLRKWKRDQEEAEEWGNS